MVSGVLSIDESLACCRLAVSAAQSKRLSSLFSE